MRNYRMNIICDDSSFHIPEFHNCLLNSLKNMVSFNGFHIELLESEKMYNVRLNIHFFKKYEYYINNRIFFTFDTYGRPLETENDYDVYYLICLWGEEIKKETAFYEGMVHSTEEMIQKLEKLIM